MSTQLAREIKLGDRSHRLVFGRLPDLGSEMSKAGLRGKALVVTNPRVMRLHGKALLEGLKGFKTAVCEIPEGEESKSEKGLAKIYDSCNRNKIERTDTILCFGGGVVGDLGGYAAANWSRGVNAVQAPTTLIAQVDSSIGGKTGIDWHGIKNKIGAFRQPRMIFTDTSVLSTLSGKHFSNGMAEVVKYGLLSAGIWTELKARKNEISERKQEALADMVWKCANMKCDYVEMDEFDDKSIRAKLNLGHTIGHAIEAASRFRLLHGEAVSLGLIAAARLSRERLELSSGAVSELVGVLDFFRLPITIRELDRKLVLNLMCSDKKVEDGNMRFALIGGIGDVTFPHIITEGEASEALACF